MSCRKEERKPIVPLKTLDVIFRRRYVPNTQHYFTDREHALSSEVLVRKPLRPYRVPKSEKLLSYIKYSDRQKKYATRNRLSQPLHLKDNLKIAATKDISERLFIKEPPDDVKAVVEIHPEFYSVIEGRPLRCFDDIKVYVNNIRNYAMNRQQIGYRRDLIINIERNLAEESEEHNKIAFNLKLYIKSFQDFLTEDYNQACAKVSEAEKRYGELVAKKSECLKYITKLTILNNVIFKLDSIRSILKMYRQFLMFTAPLPWRQVYDENLKNAPRSKLDCSFYVDNDLVDNMDIDIIVELAKKELSKPYSANIYFQRPDEMMNLFRTLELQSREYLIQLSKSQVSFHRLQTQIKHLKTITKEELDYFDYYIGTLDKELAREVYNEHHLKEKFFRILYKTFYDNIASPQSLKLKICIEYVYEEVIGKCEEGHQCLRDPMKVLEVMYEDYNLRLDKLDFNIVNKARNDLFAEDLKTMGNAFKAERELKAFREMTNAMNKAFLPPAKFKKVSTDRSNKKSKAELKKLKSANEKKIGPQKYKLSSEEKNGLLLFTEWCEGTDPGPYFDQYYQFVKSTFE